MIDLKFMSDFEDIIMEKLIIRSFDHWWSCRRWWRHWLLLR